MIVFSVGDRQYISFFLHLDTRNVRSRIYHSLSVDESENTVTEWISDDSIEERFCRISNDENWETISWNQQSVWPLTFVFSNYPSQQKSSFRFYHDTPTTFAAQYTFDTPFTANQGADLYLMGDSKGEEYIVSSFDIQFTESSSSISKSTPSPIGTNGQSAAIPSLSSGISFGMTTTATSTTLSHTDDVDHSFNASKGNNHSVTMAPIARYEYDIDVPAVSKSKSVPSNQSQHRSAFDSDALVVPIICILVALAILFFIIFLYHIYRQRRKDRQNTKGDDPPRVTSYENIKNTDHSQSAFGIKRVTKLNATEMDMRIERDINAMMRIENVDNPEAARKKKKKRSSSQEKKRPRAGIGYIEAMFSKHCDVEESPSEDSQDSNETLEILTPSL